MTKRFRYNVLKINTPSKKRQTNLKQRTWCGGISSIFHSFNPMTSHGEASITTVESQKRRLPLIGGLLAAIGLLLSGCGTLGGGDMTPRVPGEDRIKNHIYVSAGVGSSWLDPDTSEITTIGVNDRVNSGGQITVGMDVSRQLALELHSADLGSAGLSNGDRINYHIHGISALAFAGKNRHRFKRTGLSAFGRLGVGMLDNSVVGTTNYEQDNDTHILVGAGLEYMTRSGIGLRAEGIAYEEDVRYGQLGLVYRFGKQRERETTRMVEADPIEVAAALPDEIHDSCKSIGGDMARVNFHSDSDRLTNQGIEALNRVGETLMQCETLELTVAAHTDSIGTNSYNDELSSRRALTVSTHLNSVGIDASRLKSVAYGESRPIASNNDTEGRSRNRRVELIAH